LNGVPIPNDLSVAELQAIIKQPGRKTWAAVRALGQKPEPEALTCLVGLTSHLDPYVRRAAVEAIGFHQSGQSASNVICRMLHDRRGFIVRAAIQAAAKLRLDDAHDAILELVEDLDKSTRLSALMALEGLWLPSDFEPVMQTFLQDPSPEVRKQAAWTLRKNAGPECWNRLFSAWSKDSIPRHRVWACELAAQFGTRDLLPAIRDLMADRNGHVRSAATQAAAAVESR